MKASDYIVQFFAHRGVKVIFGYIGGMITHLVDSVAKSEEVRYIQTYHEQTAAIAAEGYAIETGRFGVAISTSGPGATNMLTGIADAFFDSIPVVYITGQVNAYEYKYDKPIRQQGFQETDIVSLVKPVTKYAVLVDDVKKLRYELEKAVYIATSGRKGPVVLDLPMNVQREDFDFLSAEGFSCPTEKRNSAFDEILPFLDSADRPMLLVGGGCQSEKIKNGLACFLQQTNIPVVTSLMGKGVIDEYNSAFMGMIGSYGNRAANMAISNVDLLIVLGSRLDTRQTGARIECFLPDSRIIHVDIDENELEFHRIKNRVKVNADVGDFLEFLKKQAPRIKVTDKWTKYLSSIREKYGQDVEIERFVENKVPYRFIQYLDSLMNAGDVVTTDVGQNQMWCAQSIRLKKGQRYLTSGGLAPMGYAMPSAIGCAFAAEGHQVFAIAGDGGFHMSLQSLPLISQYNLKVRVCVLNNQSLGMITQFQHLYFNDKMAGTTLSGGYRVPSIKDLCRAYDMEYFLVTEKDLDDESLKSRIQKTCSCLVEFKINDLTTVCPKLEYNQPISKPTPQLSEEEYAQAMKIN